MCVGEERVCVCSRGRESECVCVCVCERVCVCVIFIYRLYLLLFISFIRRDKHSLEEGKGSVIVTEERVDGCTAGIMNNTLLRRTFRRSYFSFIGNS